MDLIAPILRATRTIDDPETKELLNKYAGHLNKLIELRDYADSFVPKEESGRQKLRSTLQLVEARLLEVNGYVLGFVDLVRTRGLQAKGELEQYFADKLSSVMEDMKALEEYLGKWRTAVQGGKAASKESFDASLVWLRSRVDGPLARVDKKNQRLGTIISKMQRQQATNEAKRYLRHALRI